MRKSIHILLATLALLTACTGGRRAEMQQRLQALNALNRADSVLTATNRDEAQLLADYFDRHGTSNEQMLAHYLVGRCYADMHEAPMALHCYQEAIRRADTTAADCDFAQLSRVYGQSAAIFYQQGLYRNSLEYDDLSTEYAWRGNDTLTALCSYAKKASAYYQLQLKDSAILIHQDAIEKLKLYNYNKVAAGFAGTLAKLLIDKGETDKAEHCLYEHEKESGYFNESGDIGRGREVYYYFKGLYHLKKHHLDSAEYYFRKELHTGKDFNNQNCGSHGLALLFQQRHIPDSAAKYFAYSYAMNDSCFAQMSTHEVEQAKAMYDYSRQQHQSLIDRDKANREHLRFVVACSIIVAILSVLVIIYCEYRRQKKLRRQYEEKYRQGKLKYRQTLADIEQLHTREAELNEIIKNHENTINSQNLALADITNLKTELENLRKISRQFHVTVKKQEEEAANLQAQLARYQQRIDASSAESEKDISNKLHGYDIYQFLVNNVQRPITLSDKEWEKIDIMIHEAFPELSRFISVKIPKHEDMEYRVCCLVRLGLPAKSCACFLGISQSKYSKMRDILIEKLFNVKGNGTDFDRLIRSCSYFSR